MHVPPGPAFRPACGLPTSPPANTDNQRGPAYRELRESDGIISQGVA